MIVKASRTAGPLPPYEANTRCVERIEEPRAALDTTLNSRRVASLRATGRHHDVPPGNGRGAHSGIEVIRL